MKSGRFKRYLKIGLTCFITTTCLCTESLAQRWITYSTPHGLAGNNVDDILLDQTGSLWFATFSGISKFDGAWLTYKGQDELFNVVTSILEDSDGNIWFGTKGGILRIDPASNLDNPANWKEYTEDNTGGGLSNNHVTCMVIGDDGKIWFGTNGGGISRADPTPVSNNPSDDPLHDPNNWATYTTEDGLSSNVLYRAGSPTDQFMTVDITGKVWAIAGSTVRKINIYGFGAEKWNQFDFPSKTGRVLFNDKAGNLWIGTGDQGIYRINPNSLAIDGPHTVQTTNGGLASNTIASIAEDGDGVLWIGHASDGVNILLPGGDMNDPANWKQFTTLDGLGHFQINAIVEDQEENIWLGQGARGVTQLDRSWLSFEPLLQRDYDTKILFLDDERSIWIRTEEGVTRVHLDANLMFDKNLKNVFTNSSGLASNRVNTVFQDSRGYFWFGTANGARRVAKDSLDYPGRWKRLDSTTGLRFDAVRWVMEDSFDYVWLATEFNNDRNLYRVHVDSTENTDTWKEIMESFGIASVSVEEILSDMNGQLWFATDSGVSVFNPSQDLRDSENWQNYNKEDGLIDNFVRLIFEDSAGEIWFGTSLGISRIDPTADLTVPSNWTNINEENGLVHNDVFAITEVNSNEFWFGTFLGANKFETNTNRWTLFTTSNGLGANHIISLFTDKLNQDIWLSSKGGGVTRYRPKPRPPQTIIDPKTKRDIVTGNRVTFGFRATDAITPEQDLRFFYTLDSLEWQETSDNFATVFVEDSDRPERHVFQVKAIDRDGNIDSTPATDVFYKMNPIFGGNIVFIDSTKEDGYKSSLRLRIPPGEFLGDNLIKISPVEGFELSDSLLIVAYDILPQVPGFEFSKPVTLSISFLNSSKYFQDQLAIFRQNDERWDAIGGNVDTTLNKLMVTTTITNFGRYAVRSERENIVGESDKVMTIQPRVINPKSPNLGFGGKADISFRLKRMSNVTLKVYDVGGRLVRNILQSREMLQGVNSIEWDGTDRNAQPCRSGLYIILIEIDGKPETQTIVVSNSF